MRRRITPSPFSSQTRCTPEEGGRGEVVDMPVVEKTLVKYAEEQINLVAELFESVATEAAEVGRQRGWDAPETVGYMAYNLVNIIHQLTGLYVEFMKRIRGGGEAET